MIKRKSKANIASILAPESSADISLYGPTLAQPSLSGPLTEDKNS